MREISYRDESALTSFEYSQYNIVEPLGFFGAFIDSRCSVW